MGTPTTHEIVHTSLQKQKVVPLSSDAVTAFTRVTTGVIHQHPELVASKDHKQLAGIIADSLIADGAAHDILNAMAKKESPLKYAVATQGMVDKAVKAKLMPAITRLLQDNNEGLGTAISHERDVSRADNGPETGYLPSPKFAMALPKGLGTRSV